MLSRLFPYFDRCTGCNMAMLKTDPGSITHGYMNFCSADCADKYWLKRRERKAA